MSDSKSRVNKCIHCGHVLPDGASFCPYCETAQTKPEHLQAPRRKRDLIVACLFALLAVAVSVSILVYRHQPKAYQGTSRVSYPFRVQTVDVILSFDPIREINQTVSEELSIRIPGGSSDAHPLWLSVFCDDHPELAEAFAEEIEACSLQPVPVAVRADKTEAIAPSEAADETDTDAPSETAGRRDSDEVIIPSSPAPMEINSPYPVDDPSINAIWSADVFFSPENGANDLNWTVSMKNGDTIRLTLRLICSALPTVHLNYKDTPLETVEEIQRAIQSVDSDTVLTLELPPVTYDEPLILSDRAVKLYGTVDDTKRTVFANTVEIDTRFPDPAELINIAFEGNGGTGVLTHETVLVLNCTFSGWEIGIDAQESSWPVIENCTIENNRTGLRLNSSSSSSSSDGCYHTLFRDNDIAAHLIRVPFDREFGFPECTFEGNEEDVRYGLS